eukprot:jgi/Mesvir1/2010/Mv06194-RA.3
MASVITPAVAKRLSFGDITSSFGDAFLHSPELMNAPTMLLQRSVADPTPENLLRVLESLKASCERFEKVKEVAIVQGKGKSEAELRRLHELFSKLKFDYLELETKEGFMSRIAKGATSGESNPEVESVIKVEKKELKSAKEQNEATKEAIRALIGQISTDLDSFQKEHADALSQFHSVRTLIDACNDTREEDALVMEAALRLVEESVLAAAQEGAALEASITEAEQELAALRAELQQAQWDLLQRQTVDTAVASRKEASEWYREMLRLLSNVSGTRLLAEASPLEDPGIVSLAVTTVLPPATAPPGTACAAASLADACASRNATTPSTAAASVVAPGGRTRTVEHVITLVVDCESGALRELTVSPSDVEVAEICQVVSRLPPPLAIPSAINQVKNKVLLRYSTS